MSTLNDTTITKMVNDHKLITREFEGTMLKQACYQARTSNAFFEITDSSADKICIPNDECYILRPNRQVVCVTKEYFEIPLDHIARIFLLGDYFTLGIAPVNTYADPGFEGLLGIVLTNTSRNYIKIRPNTPIAKIEFSKLNLPCSKGYNGQHGGDLKSWPFLKDLIASDTELRDIKIDPTSPSEVEKIYGTDMKEIIFDVRNFSWKIGISTLISTITPLIVIYCTNTGANTNSLILSIMIGVATGVISNWVFFHLINSVKK